MLTKRIFGSRLLVYVIIGSFSLLFFPYEALSSAQTGTLTGYIFYEDLKNPVEKATVIVRNIKTKVEFKSGPTDKSGLYIIKNLEDGLYVLGVSAPQGDFNFGYQVRIKANETARLSLVLKKGKKGGAILAGAGAGVVAGAVAGAGAIAGAIGAAAGAAFFLTPVGIAVGIVVAAGLGYGLYEGTKSPLRK